MAPVNQGSFKRILVAVDGSENSKRALSLAARLADGYKSEMLILNVIDGRPTTNILARPWRRPGSWLTNK